mmetsp:Transcript_44380/g.73984  ORF Transcript_44380/g.73984 Transcript_44380/m.73984 type:complete len:382 (-) Transcript_44380:114-1259(-)|eukprot:CAMPEP_0198227078 /NCGR_PEP_ID=MMETSP1445-20131203/107811_1 /TAXON_ID=36898 /ORGANISM="Pyramimonas sp., Strain CCMP2087" /LENGTH=381 /DNA_ID=CAMNT_0043907037 /DNA_START=432 /DNA_END=1577 /DNA_ORIENTATION=+
MDERLVSPNNLGQLPMQVVTSRRIRSVTTKRTTCRGGVLLLPIWLLLSATRFKVAVGQRIADDAFYQACQSNPSACNYLSFHLTLTSTAASNTIPTEIGLLTALTSLGFYVNPNLVGTIPTEIGFLTELTTLSSYGNGLTGSIPTELGLLTNLADELRLNVGPGQGGLTGTIPTELGRLTLFTGSFSLYGNKLTGSIPSELGQLTLLAGSLDLGGMRGITGPIPSELGRLTSLRELYLNSNELTGTIPSELALMTSMTAFIVYGNEGLCGFVPAGVTLTVWDDANCNVCEITGLERTGLGAPCLTTTAASRCSTATTTAAGILTLQEHIAILRCPPSGSCKGKRAKMFQYDREAFAALYDEVKCREPDRCVVPEGGGCIRS